MSTWTKLPAIEGSTACFTCGCGSHDTFGMESMIAVGFGDASVTKDGKTVYSEPQGDGAKESDYWTGKDAEGAASQDPDHDWRIHINAPLYDAVYQRQSAGHWVLVEKGLGFA